MLDLGNRYMRECRARRHGAAFLEYHGRHQFGDLIQFDFDARHLPSAGANRLSHLMDVPVHAVKDHLNVGRHCTDSFRWGWVPCSTTTQYEESARKSQNRANKSTKGNREVVVVADGEVCRRRSMLSRRGRGRGALLIVSG